MFNAGGVCRIEVLRVKLFSACAEMNRLFLVGKNVLRTGGDEQGRCLVLSGLLEHQLDTLTIPIGTVPFRFSRATLHERRSPEQR